MGSWQLRERSRSPIRELPPSSIHHVSIPHVRLLIASRRLQLLEQRIDELVARQNDQTRIPQGSSMPTRLRSHEIGSLPSPGTVQGQTPAASTSSRISSLRAMDANAETDDIIERGIVTRELAQVLLDRFRANGMCQFPFVVVPPDTTLPALRTDAPFLFLAIAATMSFDTPYLQYKLGEEVRQQALQRILLGAEKSLDLLQGLLVYTAWYCHFYRADRHQEFLLSQLCVTLVHDLGIDKPKKRPPDPLIPCWSASGPDTGCSLANAQMRAFLGTYCVSCLYVGRSRHRPRWDDFIDRS